MDDVARPTPTRPEARGCGRVASSALTKLPNGCHFRWANRGRVGPNASAFLGAVGRSLKPFPLLKSVGEPLGNAPTEPSA